MTPRQRRMTLVVGILAGVSIAGTLALSAFRQNVTFFFDPTQVAPPDLRSTLKERKVGGMGIHFVRSLMDDVVYARADGKNCLHLRKKLPAARSICSGT